MTPNEQAAVDTATGEIRNAAISIDRRHLRAVKLFAAEKDIRYFLNGVLVHVLDDGAVRLVATNGAAIAITHSPLAELFPPAACKLIIPIDVVKLFVASKGNADIKLSTVDGKTYKMECVGLSVNFEPIEGKYPDYERVLPAAPCSEEPAQYDPSLLQMFNKAAAVYGGKDNRGLRVEYPAPGRAVALPVLFLEQR